MKKRTDMVLRKVGSKYMMVEAGRDEANGADVYTLNETAACLWERIGNEEVCEEALAQWLSDSYQIDLSRALQAVNRQLEVWRSMGLTAERLHLHCRAVLRLPLMGVISLRILGARQKPQKRLEPMNF